MGLTDLDEENVWKWEISKRKFNMSNNFGHYLQNENKRENCADISIERQFFPDPFAHPSDPIKYTFKLSPTFCSQNQKETIFCERN